MDGEQELQNACQQDWKQFSTTYGISDNYPTWELFRRAWYMGVVYQKMKYVVTGKA